MKDWRKFECNNKTIALNILYVLYNAKQLRQASTSENDNEYDNEYDDTKQIRPAYLSKHNNERDNHVNLLMIADETNNWHYLAVKRKSGLLRGITSRLNEDFYCLNCFQSYTTENKLRKHKRIRENIDFCFLKMSDEDNKILTYITGKKSLRVPLR